MRPLRRCVLDSATRPACFRERMMQLLHCWSAAGDFSSTLNMCAGSKQSCALDMHPAAIHLKDLIAEQGEFRPRATIQVPRMKHSSRFDPTLITHREIQRLVELYRSLTCKLEGLLPDFRKSRLLSKIAQANRSRFGCRPAMSHVVDNAFAWTWVPAGPNGGPALSFRIEPGKKELLQLSPERSGRAGLRPRTDNGESGVGVGRKRNWRSSGSITVTKISGSSNATADQKRDEAILAKDVRTFTHRIEPKSGDRVYSERLVRLTNKTAEPLTVSLSYGATENGVYLLRHGQRL